MPKHPDSLLQHIRDIQDQMDKYKNIFSPAIDLMNHPGIIQAQELARAVEPLGAASCLGHYKALSLNLGSITEHFQSYRNFCDEVSRSLAANSIPYLDKYTRILAFQETSTINSGLIHSSWVTTLNAQSQAQTYLASVIESAYLDAKSRLKDIGQLAGNIDIGIIANNLEQSAKRSERVIKHLDNLMASYGAFVCSVKSPQELTKLPVFVLPGASRETFTSVYALKTLDSQNHETDEDSIGLDNTITEIQRETQDCVSLLRLLNPRLLVPYAGARDALKSGNPDRTRHILSSLREFWSHLLRHLAPDDMVHKWIPSDDKKLLHNGRPTRLARIRYVCREISNDSLIAFVDFDTKSLLEMIDFFNHVHKLTHSLTEKQLRALILKTDSWIIYLLGLEKNEA